MVYFDENGEPTGAPQICPDYALSMIVALEVSDTIFAPEGVWVEQYSRSSVKALTVLKLGTPKSRGPPASI